MQGESYYTKTKSTAIYSLRKVRATARPSTAVAPPQIAQNESDARSTRSTSAEAAAAAAAATVLEAAAANAAAATAAALIYDSQTQAMVDDLSNELDSDYLSACQQHHAALLQMDRIKIDLINLKAELCVASNINGVLCMYLDLTQLCVNKIKSSVQKFSSLAAAMNTSVVIPMTGESIPNAFELGHLSGIVYILHTKYRKANFVNLASSVINLLNWSLPEATALSTPTAGIALVNKLLNEWNRNKLQEQYTKDAMFALTLANGFPLDSEVRKVAIDAVMDELSALSANTSKYPGEPMPIFTAVCAAVEDFEATSKFISKGVAAASLSQHSSGSNAPRAVRRGGRGNSETAAVAEAMAAQVTHPHQQERYNSEILRAAGKKCVTDDGKIHVYIAARTKIGVCAQCYAVPSTPCNPRGLCYCTQCTKCGSYGHRSSMCRQTVKADGSPIA